MQVKGRQKISPWDLIEGNKNPAPMLLSWFGAVRIERKPLPYQTELPRAQYHNFVKRKPLSYYLNPPDDSDDDSVDLPLVEKSPGKLRNTLESKGKCFSMLLFRINAHIMHILCTYYYYNSCNWSPVVKRSVCLSSGIHFA